MKVSLLLHFETDLKEKLKEISLEEKRSMNSLITKILFDFSKNYKNEQKQN